MRARLVLWASLAALFCAGLVAAFASGTAAGEIGALTTTAAAATTTDEQSTTVEQTSVQETTLQETTVQQTVTNTHVVTKQPRTVVVSTATEDTSSGTETWALVLIGVAIVVLVALIAWLASRHKDISPDARRRALADAVSAWVAQGWAPVSQTGSTAVLRRGDEHTVLSVDGSGNISSQAVHPDAPGS